MSKQNTKSKSVYAPAPKAGATHTHTLSILVENKPSVLARVIGLFSGRGYNIDSLTVAETDHDKSLSRITIVTSGTEIVLEQIKLQIENIIPVHSAPDLTKIGPHVNRELVLVKIVTDDKDNRIEALRIADLFKAEAVDTTLESFIFEITGTSERVNEFIELMRPLGLTELSRSGVAALSKGKESLENI